MKSFKASIFTLNSKENVTFEKHIEGEAKGTPTAKELSSLFTEQIWKAKQAQDAWQKNGGSRRALGLGKGAKMVFFAQIDGVDILNTELTETTRLKVTLGDNNKTQLRRFIEIFLDVAGFETEPVKVFDFAKN